MKSRVSSGTQQGDWRVIEPVTNRPAAVKVGERQKTFLVHHRPDIYDAK